MGEALRAALGRCACITPELCVAYMKALATDQDRWQHHIQQIRRQPKLSREEALRSLTVNGKAPLTWYTRTTTSASVPRATRRRQSLATLVPAWRPVRAGELQAAIQLPPSATVPRGYTASRQASPLLQRAGAAPSHAAHALETAKIALACQQHHVDGDGHGDEPPFQQVHP